MTQLLFSCIGGTLVCPNHLLCDRADGGHLVVNPPRAVWERSCLSPLELAHWSFLVAATGRAMLEVLPALHGGCINYWEAGNWALNELAVPTGPKVAQDHRRVHLHLLGRSRSASHPDWRWGESPKFPGFACAADWAAEFSVLTELECAAVVQRVQSLLSTTYPMLSDLP
jgi:diadenosine tetraphosphate (Ap4A) HIT family hydrolase